MAGNGVETGSFTVLEAMVTLLAGLEPRKGESERDAGFGVVLKTGVRIRVEGGKPGEEGWVRRVEGKACHYIDRRGVERTAPLNRVFAFAAEPADAPTGELPAEVNGRIVSIFDADGKLSREACVRRAKALVEHGEPAMQGAISERDRRLGVPVPLGAAVLLCDGAAIVIGGSSDYCVAVDAKGEEHCVRWGEVDVQASGPAFPVGSPGFTMVGDAATPAAQGFTTIDPAQVIAARTQPITLLPWKLHDVAQQLGREADAIQADDAELSKRIEEAVLKLTTLGRELEALAEEAVQLKLLYVEVWPVNRAKPNAEAATARDARPAA